MTLNPDELAAEGAPSGEAVLVPVAPAFDRPSTRPRSHAKFTQGSILRHTLVMTGTGSVGAVAIFAVDLLSLLYVSWLGRTDLKAAVGFATQVLVYPVAINIGLTIAITAAVSRALGAGDRASARRLAGSGLTIVAVLSSIVTAMALFAIVPLLEMFGARGPTLDVAARFLLIALPGNIPFALGMALSGILRAVGDARRAMYVTLTGALVTAAVDPVLIFGLGLGVYGAAISTLLSRFIFLAVGYHGAATVHGLVARPRLTAVVGDAAALMSVAAPAVLTNLATPFGSGYALHVYARFGNSAVAASVIIDRIAYVAFAVVFALTGAVGPILGQNLGALCLDRVKQTLTTCFGVTLCYAVATWAVLALASPALTALFRADPEMTGYIRFFCSLGVSAWVFIAVLFVANAAFNNLGYPLLAMTFNWGRATLGTVPFVTLGAAMAGVRGGQIGIAVGAAIFGSAALAAAYHVVDRISRRAGAPSGSRRAH